MYTLKKVRVAECSAPHSSQVAAGNREVGGERGSDCVSWCSDVEEARKVWSGKVVEGPAGEP